MPVRSVITRRFVRWRQLVGWSASDQLRGGSRRELKLRPRELAGRLAVWLDGWPTNQPTNQPTQTANQPIPAANQPTPIAPNNQQYDYKPCFHSFLTCTQRISKIQEDSEISSLAHTRPKSRRVLRTIWDTTSKKQK